MFKERHGDYWKWAPSAPPAPLAPPAFTPFEVVHAYDYTFYTKLEMKTEITWSLDWLCQKMAANVFHHFSYIINMKLALLVCPVSFLRTVLFDTYCLDLYKRIKAFPF